MISILTYILVLLEAIVCFLLISIILVQRSKSQGVGMAFGAGMGETLFGSHIGNVLTKTTIVLGIVFLVNTTILAVLSSRSTSGVSSVTDTIPVAKAPVQQMPVQQDPAQLPPQTEQMPMVMDDNIQVAAPEAVAAPAAKAAPVAETPAAEAAPTM